MNILFDINHPAHVHLFKNAVHILKAKGHHVVITSRDKDITVQLLNNLNLPHIVLSKAQKGLFRLSLELVWKQMRLLPILLKNKIQVCVSVTGACNVHICKLLGIPTLVFYDTEHATLQNKLTVPFATYFITPESFEGRYGKNHITYQGTHDLAYLHPKYFTPNAKIYNFLGLRPQEKYTIIRFVSWQAAHDMGYQGIPIDLKRKIIEMCAQQGKVFIVSEDPNLGEFREYQLNIPPEKMHDVLAFASLYIGEGGSMATEAAILGTPAIFVSPLSAGVFQYLETYDLMYAFKPHEETKIFSKIQFLLKSDDIKSQWQAKRQKFISENIDLTEWMTEFILSQKLGKS